MIRQTAEFKDRLKELRLEKGLTQQKLAQALRISDDCVYAWEKGRSEPYIGMLCKISKYFAVTSDYLLGLED